MMWILVVVLVVLGLVLFGLRAGIEDLVSRVEELEEAKSQDESPDFS
jgi:hypothetical protein